MNDFYAPKRDKRLANIFPNHALSAQIVAIVAVCLSLAGSVLWWMAQTEPVGFDAFFYALGWNLAVPLTLAPLGALIVRQRPGNNVGWLMLIGALGSANPVPFMIPVERPLALTPLLFVVLWIEGWSWIPPIFALFLIPLFFPNGKLPSPRWRWLLWLASFMWVTFAVLTLIVNEIGPINEQWEPFLSPFGLVPISWLDGPFLLIWFGGLLTLLFGSVLSLLIRYLYAKADERQQIKWLLLAGAQFLAIYSLAFFSSEFEDDSSFGFLFLLSALAIPAAVAIAILRYRLYDIDVIIRKTLLYAVLSGLLAIVYFSAVIVLQWLVGRTAVSQSPLIIVLSTLLIAALFAPLRDRIQHALDRRFYREKVDRQQVLARFAQTARDEVSLAALEAEVVRVVQETMQPVRTGVWMADVGGKQ